MFRAVAFALMSGVFFAGSHLGVAQAQDQPRPASQCQAIAETVPKASFVSFKPQQMAQARKIAEDVRITFIGHSTYSIESRKGC